MHPLNAKSDEACEMEAIRADARERLPLLRLQRAQLRPDAPFDPEIRAELATVAREIVACEIAAGIRVIAEAEVTKGVSGMPDTPPSSEAA